ncbi:hypothetical protein CRG98_029165 [Punica granatum]|uniref:Uncharacterized protein n=1 Tax=Punica granatum TaxID=22663 RepID=A0A2I0J2F1_PUNGR|nr:hypothetical protein CRG98_029165 [Punica granatum]
MGPSPYKLNKNLIWYQSLGYAYECLRACAHPHHAGPSMSSAAKSTPRVSVPPCPSMEDEPGSKSIIEDGCLRAPQPRDRQLTVTLLPSLFLSSMLLPYCSSPPPFEPKQPKFLLLLHGISISPLMPSLGPNQWDLQHGPHALSIITVATFPRLPPLVPKLLNSTARAQLQTHGNPASSSHLSGPSALEQQQRFSSPFKTDITEVLQPPERPEGYGPCPLLLSPKLLLQRQLLRRFHHPSPTFCFPVSFNCPPPSSRSFLVAAIAPLHHLNPLPLPLELLELPYNCYMSCG